MLHLIAGVLGLEASVDFTNNGLTPARRQLVLKLDKTVNRFKGVRLEGLSPFLEVLFGWGLCGRASCHIVIFCCGFLDHIIPHEIVIHRADRA